MKEKTKKIRLVKKWIAALRSGEYKQGRGKLVKGDRFCCLGVLCDVAKKEFNLEITNDSVQREDESYSGELPGDVKEYFGLDLSIRTEDMGYTRIFQSKLMDMNDGDAAGKGYKSFKTIAKFLENNLLPILEQE